MEKKENSKNLSLLDEPLFSLAFGRNKEDFSLLWSLLTEEETPPEMEALMEDSEGKLTPLPVVAGVAKDEGGVSHLLSIIQLRDLERDEKSFVRYLVEVIRRSKEEKFGEPWFCIIVSMEGRSRDLAFFMDGDGERSIHVHMLNDANLDFTITFGITIIDLTAPTKGDGWKAVSADLLETSPSRIQIPELRRILSSLKSEKGRSRINGVLQSLSKEREEAIRKRLENLGFSKEEVEKMMN